MIRSVRPEDAEAICAIYNHYIEHTFITFEEAPLAASEMAARVAEISGRFPYLVLELEDGVAGYAYANLWRTRRSYRNTIESTIYLHYEKIGRGNGARLYGALLEQVHTAGFHAVVGGIALPNAGSVALHEKCGFVKVAHFPEVGWKFGRWIDVGYWQRTFQGSSPFA